VAGRAELAMALSTRGEAARPAWREPGPGWGPNPGGSGVGPGVGAGTAAAAGAR
jgi:hypothetical protein